MTNAWVYLVMKGDSYATGAAVCAYSLRLVNTVHQLVCMVTHDVSATARQQMAVVFDKIVEVDYVREKCVPMITEKQREMYDAWTCDSFTKWCALSLVEYDRVIFIDADKIVLRNIDHLFDLQPPAATFSCPWAAPFKRRSKNKEVDGFHNPYQGIGHGELIPSTCVHEGLTKNSFVAIGTMVLLEPNVLLLDSFKRFIRENSHGDKGFGFETCNSMIDEQSIVSFYHDLHLKASANTISTKYQWTMISQEHNFIPWHPQWLQGKLPSVFHFFKEKPWKCPRRAYPDFEAWWRVVVSLLDSITDAPTKALVKKMFSSENLALQPWQICSFCQQTGEGDEVATDHCLFDCSGKINCPKLRP